jgi:S-adenosylmethionine/arginine decarboxylase-like enzyme
MHPTITNFIIEIRCKSNASLLDEKADILINSIVTNLGYNVLERSSHTFKPQGKTSLLLLEESHISIHTWPDKGYALIELLTCKVCSGEESRLIRKEIEHHLGVKNISIDINSYGNQ